ncbi:MAG TPA: NAD(P)/FAD-dependent oxidoreductase [Candidatus Acidoferrales bacterium]|jgi:monoamine oxidase|nr:NAD(P)/FAD-dependent oxidoreductase [Candidatus Acidoferrales bacterium]
MSNSVSRRDFAIGAAAGIGALAGCAGPLTSSVPQGLAEHDLAAGHDVADANGVYDCVVVGAGAAGIAAARGVLAAKRRVLVLEAQPYIGGRCRSDTSLGVAYDSGAQFMAEAQSLNTTLYPLAVQLGIPMIPGETVARGFFNAATGTLSPNHLTNEFYATFAAANAAVQATGLDITLGGKDRSIAAVMRQAGLTDAPYINLAYQFLMRVFDGGTPETQSTLDLFNEIEFVPAPFIFPPNDSLYMPNGYGTFLAGLAKGLPIRTNSPVKKIDYHGANVVLTLASGQTVTAKTAIVTASINVLKDSIMKFTPVLPASHRKALSGMTMGHAYKTMLQFKGKPFNGSKLKNPKNQTFTSIPLVNQSTATYIVNYFAESYNLPGSYMMVIAEGEEAVAFEKMTPQQVGQTLCGRIETTYPGVTAAWTGGILTSNWATNPYTQGCLAYATPGNAGARVELGKSIDQKLWFAGEAISVHQHATVNGAWASGTEAAYAAMAAIGAVGKLRHHA